MVVRRGTLLSIGLALKVSCFRFKLLRVLQHHQPIRSEGRADARRHFRQGAIVLRPRSEFSHPRHQFMLRNDGRSHYIDCRADTSNVALQALRGGYLDDQLVRHA